MAYNPYTAVNKITEYKKAWTDANNAGDETKRNDAAEKAKAYYKELSDNGYGDVATQLSQSDYNTAQSISNKYAKSGKTAIRPYFYTLGSKYGLSNADVDKLLTYDEQTGEVSLGGKNIGKPFSEVDGISYWDTDKLDSEWQSYVDRSGIARSDEQLEKSYNENIYNKTNQLWGIRTGDHNMMNNNYNHLLDYNYNTNPYETEIGKSVMEGYTWKGEQAGNNEIASGASSNGGNIDSFSAANASRQQLAFTNAGKAAVLQDHNSRVSNAMNILNNMGVYQQNSYAGMENTINTQQNESQRLFENRETAKNNAVARESEIASITGYSTSNQLLASNPFFNSEGQIKSEYSDTDFKNIINNAVANGDYKTAQYARVARAHKIFGNYDEYGQFDDGDYTFIGGDRTAEYDLTQQQIDSNERMNDSNNKTTENIANIQAKNNLDINNANNKTTENVANIQAKNNLDINNANNKTSLELAESQGNSSSGNNTYNKEAVKQQTDATLSHWLYSPWADFDKTEEFRKGYSTDTSKRTQYMAAEKMADPDMRSYIKAALVAGGYSVDQATSKMQEYETNIAIQIAKIESKDYNDTDVINSIKDRYGFVYKKTSEKE